MSNYTNNEIVHIKCENGVEYLQFKKLNEFNDKLVHGIFLRHGGVSENEYLSLNTRFAGSDKKTHVLENYNRIKTALNLNNVPVLKASQAHTDNILELNDKNYTNYLIQKQNVENFDAYILKDKNLSCVVTTADCIPIIIYDKEKNIVANIHSGWKGTLKQIYLKVIEKMKIEYNSNIKDLIVCLGPSIEKCCFTSKEKEFKEKFTNIWMDEKDYIYYEEDKETFHIDMKKIVKQDLISIGIEQNNIFDANICTKCNSHDFFSYRKATQNKEKDYGTFGTIVSLK